jgi:hypothetical protein
LNGWGRSALRVDLPLLGVNLGSLTDVVAAHLAQWQTPFVELAIYGHANWT